MEIKPKMGELIDMTALRKESTAYNSLGLNEMIFQIWNEVLLEADDCPLSQNTENLLIEFLNSNNSSFLHLATFIESSGAKKSERVGIKKILFAIANLDHSYEFESRLQFIKGFLNSSSEFLREIAIYSLQNIDTKSLKLILKNHLKKESSLRIKNIIAAIQ